MVISMNMKHLAAIALTALTLAGCAESTSTATAPPPDAPSISMAIPSEGRIIQIDEMQLYELVSSSFQQVIPEAKVSVITFPERGYTAKWLAPPFYLDWYYFTVKMLRAEGRDSSGKKVSGFIVDVSGRGSALLSGRSKRKQLSDLIGSALYEYGTPVMATGLKRANFNLKKEKMYVVGADHLR